MRWVLRNVVELVLVTITAVLAVLGVITGEWMAVLLMVCVSAPAWACLFLASHRPEDVDPRGTL